MAQDHIRYDVLTQDALRSVVRKVLGEVEVAGLPGDHHFFISFSTRAPGVRISKKLLDQYEEEMTIVIQNQYRDLKTSDTGFEIGLSFDGISEVLIIPFTALKGFFDPSVEFGMQFEPAQTDMETPAKGKKAPAAKEAKSSSSPKSKTEKEEKSETEEKVISLDSFRNK